MTVIAAAYDKTARRAVVAADSRCTWGDHVTFTDDKIRPFGAAVVGMSGYALFARALDALADDLSLKVQPTDPGDAAAWDAWVWRFTEALNAWARGKGHGATEKGLWELPGVSMLIATPAGLWRMSGGAHCLRVHEPYLAIGSGGEVALGVLHALSRLPGCPTPTPVERVFAAALAACDTLASCGEPIHTLTTGENP